MRKIAKISRCGRSENFVFTENFQIDNVPVVLVVSALNCTTLATMYQGDIISLSSYQLAAMVFLMVLVVSYCTIFMLYEGGRSTLKAGFPPACISTNK